MNNFLHICGVPLLADCKIALKRGSQTFRSPLSNHRPRRFCQLQINNACTFARANETR
jgi:hypothetical protein